jgi:hypothetical protein
MQRRHDETTWLARATFLIAPVSEANTVAKGSRGSLRRRAASSFFSWHGQPQDGRRLHMEARVKILHDREPPLRHLYGVFLIGEKREPRWEEPVGLRRHSRLATATEGAFSRSFASIPRTGRRQPKWVSKKAPLKRLFGVAAASVRLFTPRAPGQKPPPPPVRKRREFQGFQRPFSAWPQPIGSGRASHRPAATAREIAAVAGRREVLE